MKTLIGLVLAALLAIPVAALAIDHAVKLAEKTGIGKYLTDADGRTLYWFKLDAPGKSACAGPCVEKWPLYFRETVAPPEGLALTDFGTLTRDDGKKQTTFRHYPLYYFAGDERAGDTKGQGVKEIWFVVDPVNFPIK